MSPCVDPYPSPLWNSRDLMSLANDRIVCKAPYKKIVR